jgi:hypothetical protein
MVESHDGFFACVARKQLMEIIMSILPRRLSIVGAACLLFGLATTQSANALVLDWDGVAWSPGSLINSYDLNGDALNDVTVTVNSQQANIWQNDPTSGIQTPVVNQTLTGGILPPQSSLMLAANLHTNSSATVNLSFPASLGAINVSFMIFDIDVTTNADIISNIYGVALDGSHVAATITNVGSGVTLSGSGLTYKLTGNAASPNNSSNGNVTITFGSTLISDVFFTFGNTAGAPRYQDIALGDVNFTPVPEMNPAAVSVGSCLLAVGMMVFVHRRRKSKASDSDSVGS